MRELRPEAILDDLQKVVADTEHLLRVTAADTSDVVVQTRSRVEKSLRTSRAQLNDLEHATLRRARRTAPVAKRYARENPWQAVGVIAGVALAAGYLISRR